MEKSYQRRCPGRYKQKSAQLLSELLVGRELSRLSASPGLLVEAFHNLLLSPWVMSLD